MAGDLSKKIEALRVRVESQQEDMDRLGKKLDNISKAVDHLAEEVKKNDMPGDILPGSSQP